MHFLYGCPCVCQIWDLRFATAPVRILEHHKRGVLSIAWCPQDSDLLLSAAKDNQVLCWNPNSEQPGGEVGVVVLPHVHVHDISDFKKYPSMVPTFLYFDICLSSLSLSLSYSLSIPFAFSLHNMSNIHAQ